MNVTLLACFNGRSASVSMHRPVHYAALGAAAVAVIALAAAIGFQVGQVSGQGMAADAWQAELRDQERELRELRESKRSEVAALSERLADLRGRLTALDALGRKLVDATDLDLGELGFESAAGAGGPLIEVGSISSEAGFSGLERQADRLAGRIEDRKRKFSVIEGFLVDRDLRVETTPAGWPIDGGWISSSFGHRNDPLTGRRAFHAGTDFATHPGRPVYAIAGGVVTYSGPRGAYGNLVEINHGNGYTTRYGHNRKNLVRVGEVVRAGDAIAEVGSTGRSTGAHVHLEVREHGRPRNPAPYASAER